MVADTNVYWSITEDVMQKSHYGWFALARPAEDAGQVPPLNRNWEVFDNS